MGKLSKALGFPKSMGDDAAIDEAPDMSSETPEEDAAEPGVGKAEVLAMKQFERATTTEAKAQALKDFVEACTSGGY